MSEEKRLQQKYETLLPHLNERQRRLVAAADAQTLGYGGISQVARATGLSRATVQRGVVELQALPLAAERVRQVGGGRKRLATRTPTILHELEWLVDPLTRGDPQSPLRWTCKSTRQLAQTLSERG